MGLISVAVVACHDPYLPQPLPASGSNWVLVPPLLLLLVVVLLLVLLLPPLLLSGCTVAVKSCVLASSFSQKVSVRTQDGIASV